MPPSSLLPHNAVGSLYTLGQSFADIMLYLITTKCTASIHPNHPCAIRCNRSYLQYYLPVPAPIRRYACPHEHTELIRLTVPNLRLSSNPLSLAPLANSAFVFFYKRPQLVSSNGIRINILNRGIVHHLRFFYRCLNDANNCVVSQTTYTTDTP